ncbi:hypothetical protein [Paraburkholderia megapolitana]|uniref:Uncharacterized protein n=1 Tax=Paraburkholderia megapolitana TaxID=420953 RepID=A0A1I3VPP1_9BURK|nr:hypothetical protein [Paraburkholderia megapolitana]QDQ84733.1 hypothetical protein FNZ07_27110 [Paraburkholderia megapolitana]SFJ96286.1 hypothetical protein SAMN05192543_11437 [Paraburkholderia megapolitana]
MTQLKTTLWQAIDTLVAQLPFSKAKVETALGTPLREVDRNTYTVFLESADAVQLADNERIAKIDLRLGSEQAHPGLLSLDLEGGCINLDAVRAHYSNLKITDIPRGRSLDEATTHSAALPWGKLSFGFKERAPNCLAYVVLAPGEGD